MAGSILYSPIRFRLGDHALGIAVRGLHAEEFAEEKPGDADGIRVGVVGAL